MDQEETLEKNPPQEEEATSSSRESGESVEEIFTDQGSLSSQPNLSRLRVEDFLNLDTVAKVKAKYKEITKREDTLRREAETARLEIQSLNKQLEKTKKVCEKLRLEYSELIESHSTNTTKLEKELVRIRARNLELHTEVENQRILTSQAWETAQESEAALKRGAQETQRKLTKAIDELDIALRERERDIDRLTTQTQDLERFRTEESAKNQRLSEENSSLRIKVEELKNEIDTLREKLHSNSISLNALKEEQNSLAEDLDSEGLDGSARSVRDLSAIVPDNLGAADISPPRPRSSTLDKNSAQQLREIIKGPEVIGTVDPSGVTVSVIQGEVKTKTEAEMAEQPTPLFAKNGRGTIQVPPPLVQIPLNIPAPAPTAVPQPVIHPPPYVPPAPSAPAAEPRAEFFLDGHENADPPEKAYGLMGSLTKFTGAAGTSASSHLSELEDWLEDQNDRKPSGSTINFLSDEMRVKKLKASLTKAARDWWNTLKLPEEGSGADKCKAQWEYVKEKFLAYYGGNGIGKFEQTQNFNNLKWRAHGKDKEDLQRFAVRVQTLGRNLGKSEEDMKVAFIQGLPEYLEDRLTLNMNSVSFDDLVSTTAQIEARRKRAKRDDSDDSVHFSSHSAQSAFDRQDSTPPQWAVDLQNRMSNLETTGLFQMNQAAQPTVSAGVQPIPAPIPATTTNTTVQAGPVQSPEFYYTQQKLDELAKAHTKTATRVKSLETFQAFERSGSYDRGSNRAPGRGRGRGRFQKQSNDAPGRRFTKKTFDIPSAELWKDYVMKGVCPLHTPLGRGKNHSIDECRDIQKLKQHSLIALNEGNEISMGAGKRVYLNAE